jgi:hypothetical protein
MAANVLNILLTHQMPDACQALIQRVSMIAQDENLLLVYGGSQDVFHEINYEPKLFIEDQRLRTHDHQREMQSYTGIFRAGADWMKSRPFEFIHFFEYDHLPLVPDLNVRHITRLQQQGADVLGYHLARIDGTSHPHFLQHAAYARFAQFLHKISCRDDRDVILSMFVTGSFWTREAFESVAVLDEPCPVYMEVYLPTIAHHLGFRLRDYGDQDRFVSHRDDRSQKIDGAQRQGAWTLHPVKDLKALLSFAPSKQ